MSDAPSISSRLRQRGVSLVVVLILLLIMTLLGLAVLRSTVLEERMSANLLDRNLSFQAAEAALREGEALAASRTNAEHTAIAAAAAGGGCTNGVCPRPDATAVERWKNTSFGGWRAATTSVGSVASAPQFFIEYMGTSETWLECNLDPRYTGSDICLRPVYRITARSEAAGRASVIVQSNFIVP
ncbi:PilX N-terminal domain-containing pilus assembly protein [Xanthomonas campestris pv. raphani]|uniref:pilus assembly PilX family protein n=1 Tax=Xanthomonas campestris TaxID=339 RepID=UPI002B22CED2|nr:PilX N-terminal domain-containing pilus assembly protein [Xanthomonas campestris]MEA9787824.1 PilX N-terminal domain-containing pilus assembly protein [Xanthomonas campestris pv. raphani]MEA9827240.1 PilX N-terminal domain-containing pilus assembly protein [Xanthomonas campestris pv. raphani]MEB2184436.1 PilX N-terminal domain-containing pilus assembly protein [Xanthomonas campestris pv. campestris]